MKAILYLRVSSSRQIDNTSLATQKAACQKWCEDHELEIDRVFVEAGESAKSENRTEFQRMFRYLETVGNRISHVVVWKFDRFSRSVDDMAIYSRKLRMAGIALVSVTEHADPTPMGRAMRGIASVFDQLDNENRAVRTHVSMRATFAAGRWTWGAPIGYIYVEKHLKIDPVRGPLIVKLFEMIATGQATKANALAHLTRLGLRTVRGNKPLNSETVARLLKNELYAGWMVAKKWDLRVKGNFTPLISEELFYRVQGVLAGRTMTTAPHKRQNENFPLKGSLLCNVCNSPVTGATSTGKMGLRFPKDSLERDKHRYGYYRCYKASGHFNVRANVVEDALETLLKKMEPDPDRMNAVVKLFRAVWNERTAVQQIEVNGMKSALRKLEAKEARLLDSLAEGTITNAAFKRANDPIMVEADRLRQELASQKFDELDVDDAVGYLQSMFWNLLTLWDSNDLQEKSSMLKMLFPAGLFFNSGVLEPKLTHSFFTSLSAVEFDESVLASLAFLSLNQFAENLSNAVALCEEIACICNDLHCRPLLVSL